MTRFFSYLRKTIQKTVSIMKALTSREEEVLEFFWEKGPLYVREIVQLYDEPRPHFNTLSTFVRSLEEKGYVGHETLGASHRYFAKISREAYNRKCLKGVIGKYFNHSYLGAVSSLVQEEEISLDELKELIRQVEEGNAK